MLQDELLKALASTASAGTDASPLVKEDLEVEAHTQLWLETDPVELVILKHLPHVQAFSVLHEFDQIIGYGARGHDGFYGENSLPAEAAIQSRRKTVNIRLMGDISSVFALASFQTPIQALGQSNLVDENMASTRLDLLHKMAVAVYNADDGSTTHTLRFKGLRQQILEGTSPSSAAPFTINPDYIIDLRGAKLDPPEIRKRARQVRERFGAMRWLYMAPSVSEFLEESLDPAERLMIPRTPGDAVILGQNIGGMNTAGGITRFAVDNTLTSSLYMGAAPLVAETNAPAPLPAGNIAAPVVAADAASLWGAADADAAVVYDITALNAAGESTATRVGPIAVAAGQKVTIAITPRAADTSYRIYRGDSTLNPPLFIREIKGTGNTTAFNFVDLNERIPGTTDAFGLNIASANSDAMRMNDMSRVTLQNPPRPRNTASLVTLGPWMGIFELAHILHTASRDLLFSAFTPQITHPYQNVVWINVGDR
jgi:hypothetical protein